jgi:hypothetical protein
MSTMKKQKEAEPTSGDLLRPMSERVSPRAAQLLDRAVTKPRPVEAMADS